MASGAPIRIETDLSDAARALAPHLSRSATQQVNHWARIGREREASRSVSHRDIQEVLAGRSEYDALNVCEQAIIRAEWAERITTLRTGLDLEAELLSEGDTWVEADEHGNLIERSSTSTQPEIATASAVKAAKPVRDPKPRASRSARRDS